MLKSKKRPSKLNVMIVLLVLSLLINLILGILALNERHRIVHSPDVQLKTTPCKCECKVNIPKQLFEVVIPKK